VPKEFCATRSLLIAELATATKRLDEVMDNMDSLMASSAVDVAKLMALQAELGNVAEDGFDILRRLNLHRAEHDC
jgi:hypothetical protein